VLYLLQFQVNLPLHTTTIAVNEDISLKQLFLQVGEHISNLLRSWKFIALCGFGLAFIMLGLNFFKPKLYAAELSFMVNDDDGGALGSMASMLGQFGLAGPGSAESNLDKIIELSRARTITQKALFNKMALDGNSNYLANHLINSLENRKKWIKKGPLSFLSSDDGLSLKDFKFQHDSFPTFSILENKALKKLHLHLIGKEKQGQDFQSDYSELSGIMTFRVTSDHPDLSINLVSNIFDELSNYYEVKSAEKQRHDYKIIKTKYDSIQTQLNAVQYSMAKFDDEHIGLVRRQDQLRKKQLQGEEMKLGAMLGEAEKQLQISQLALESNSAFIQVIDRPILPLRPVNKGKLYYFLLGGLLGGLFSCLYVVIKKMWRDIMTSN